MNTHQQKLQERFALRVITHIFNYSLHSISRLHGHSDDLKHLLSSTYRKGNQFAKYLQPRSKIVNETGVTSHTTDCDLDLLL